MPKKSGLINERELAICARLRDLRSRSGFSQSELARAIGTTRDLLASVEYGRNPLRYWLADRLCEKFDVCQQWLAVGEEPMKGYVGLPPETGLEIAHRQLFSVAYERRIGHMVKQQIQDTESLKRSIAAQAGGADKLLEDRLYNLALCWFGRIPVHLYDEYFRELMAASSDFFQRNLHRFPTGTWPPPAVGPTSRPQYPKENNKNVLTESESTAILPPVKSQLKHLLATLDRLTQESGKKTELAEFLGAPLASVSRWLSGEREPGGETTLKMLRWVQEHESQQNTPDGEINTVKGKTQVRSSKAYEKTKSSPPKR